MGHSLRLNPSNQTIAEYVTTPLDDYSSPEPIGDIGGPILRDRVWFYAGYDPSWTNRTRTVRFSSNQQTGTFSQKPVTNLFNYNVTGQIARNHGDALQGGSARRRHLQRRPAPHVPGVEFSVHRHPAVVAEDQRLCRQPVELAIRARRPEPLQFQRGRQPLRQLARPAHHQGRAAAAEMGLLFHFKHDLSDAAPAL